MINARPHGNIALLGLKNHTSPYGTFFGTPCTIKQTEQCLMQIDQLTLIPPIESRESKNVVFSGGDTHLLKPEDFLYNVANLELVS